MEWSVATILSNVFHMLLHHIHLDNNVPESIQNTLQEYKRVCAFRFLFICQYQPYLLELPYTSIFEYLLLLKQISIACQDYRSRVMLYSAAAVSDFYIPFDQMQTHKIQSSDGVPTLQLTNSPKMLLVATKEWLPEAYVVSFKLETDTSILLQKATSAIQKYFYAILIQF